MYGFICFTKVKLTLTKIIFREENENFISFSNRFSIFTSVNAQDSTSNKIAVLPFISNGIDLASVQTAESILRMELSNESTIRCDFREKNSCSSWNEDCTDEDCAKEVGEKLECKTGFAL